MFFVTLGQVLNSFFWVLGCPAGLGPPLELGIELKSYRISKIRVGKGFECLTVTKPKYNILISILTLKNKS